jgi:cell division protein ZapA (FtsZ GTPase activity inhibitor)
MQPSEIQIQIGNRTYPLQAPAEELERLRQAESLLNERLTQYKSQHPGADRFDLLGMTAYFLAHSLLQAQGSPAASGRDQGILDEATAQQIGQELEALESSLNRTLQKRSTSKEQAI